MAEAIANAILYLLWSYSYIGHVCLCSDGLKQHKETVGKPLYIAYVWCNIVLGTAELNTKFPRKLEGKVDLDSEKITKILLLLSSRISY